MGKRKREIYRNGDFTLGRRGREAVADYSDEAGERRRARLNVPFATMGPALERAKTALDEFAENFRALAAQRASYTIGQLWKLWLDERADDGFSNKIYASNWKALGPFFGNRLPLNLEATDCRIYARGRFDAGIAPATVNTELRRLSSCLKWSFETRKLPVRVKVWVPSPGKPRERVLTIEEAKALVAGAARGDPHIYLFVMVAFATGARHGAILDLTWDRIDFGYYPDMDGGDGELRPGIIDFDEPILVDPMSRSWKKGRATVPMNRAVRRALLDAYAARQSDHVIEHGGKRIYDADVGFRNATIRAGLGRWVPDPKPRRPDNQRWETDVTPHTIRHTVATWLTGKVDDTRRQQLLGHDDVETTRKVYTHAPAILLTDAVEILGAEFAPLPRIGHRAVDNGVEEAEEVGNLSQRDKPAKRKRPKKAPRKGGRNA